MSAKSLFSVTDFISTFHTPLTHDHKCAKLKKYFSATQCDTVQQAWTANFARFPCQNFDFQRVQGAAAAVVGAVHACHY